MNTMRVNICYRPLRIGWLIRAGDLKMFRRVVRISHTIWGGRFNPIIVIDREEEARRLVDLFRVDLLLSLDEGENEKEFVKKFPYLIKPFFFDSPFIGKPDEARAQLLDVHNAMAHLRGKPQWEALKKKGFLLHNWEPTDPLADVLLLQLGGYPDPKEIGIDYLELFKKTAKPEECHLDPTKPIPAEILDHPSITYLSRFGLKPHYSVQNYWDYPGFFLGSAKNFDDLVCHWNLRAANIALWFIDAAHIERYSKIIADWAAWSRELVQNRHEWDRRVAVWSLGKHNEEALKAFGDIQLSRCSVSEHVWNGKNIRAPMMFMGETSVLGVMTEQGGDQRVSFALSDKPLSHDQWFYTQHLVASVSFRANAYRDEQRTLAPPYLPELNEFYARSMHFEYNSLRIEPDRIGLVVPASKHDDFVDALPVADLMSRIFNMAGFASELSSGGLIARQLIARLGGIDGGRPFKIPGVRRLFKTYGPTESFSKAAAVQLIGRRDPANPEASFEAHERLFIEPRPLDAKLKPIDVFSYLVAKGLFRIGARLACPNCRMSSWTALDTLKQDLVCDLCGHKYDSTRQLVNGEWHYRRTGIFGAERNSQGAVPVILTLQQLEANLHGIMEGSAYSPSLNLVPREATALPKCEVDFVWLIPRPYPRKTVVILAECKDQGPIDATDFANLRRVADALPRKRFKTYVLMAKLSPFTDDEIQLAFTHFRDEYRQRAIMLTAKELEPWHIYERVQGEGEKRMLAGSPEDLADATAQIYFKRMNLHEQQT